jgi:hypothetical protein
MTRRLGVSVALVCGLSAAIRAQAPRVHDLPLRPETIHWGYYDAKIPPALRVASGDRVRVETMVAGGLQRLRLAGVPESDIPESMKVVEERVTERGPGTHPMSGPIFVEGAQPGDVLEIRIIAIDYLHNYGVNTFSPGGGVLPDDYPYAGIKLIRWPAGATSVQFAPGITLPMAPFFGSIGVAPPPLVGRISSRPPGYYGARAHRAGPEFIRGGATFTSSWRDLVWAGRGKIRVSRPSTYVIATVGDLLPNVLFGRQSSRAGIVCFCGNKTRPVAIHI